MSKHKNKNRTPKKTFLDAMREIEPSLTEDNLFSEIYDNALEIEDVGYEDINAAYADVDSDMMTSDTVIFSKIGNKYLVLFDRDDYTSAEADAKASNSQYLIMKAMPRKSLRKRFSKRKLKTFPTMKLQSATSKKPSKNERGTMFV